MNEVYENLNFTVWRHKYHRDKFLVFEYDYENKAITNKPCPFTVTNNVLDAIANVQHCDEYCGGFTNLYEKYVYSEFWNTIVLKDSKEVDLDGYIGTVTKEIQLPLGDFEKVNLIEMSDAHVNLLEQITKLQTENNLLKHEFATANKDTQHYIDLYTKYELECNSLKKLLDEGIKKNWLVKHVLDAYRATQPEVN